MTSSNCEEMVGFIKYLLKTVLGHGRKNYKPCYGLSELTVVPVCAKSLHSYLTLQPDGQAARQAPLSVDSPGENSGVGCHAPLQGTFPSQGSNPRL